MTLVFADNYACISAETIPIIELRMKRLRALHEYRTLSDGWLHQYIEITNSADGADSTHSADSGASLTALTALTTPTVMKAMTR